MAVKIVEVKRETCPAARFIGKKYDKAPNWGEWWENEWFSIFIFSTGNLKKMKLYRERRESSL